MLSSAFFTSSSSLNLYFCSLVGVLPFTFLTAVNPVFVGLIIPVKSDRCVSALGLLVFSATMVPLIFAANSTVAPNAIIVPDIFVGALLIYWPLALTKFQIIFPALNSVTSLVLCSASSILIKALSGMVNGFSLVVVISLKSTFTIMLPLCPLLNPSKYTLDFKLLTCAGVRLTYATPSGSLIVKVVS